MTCQSAQIGTPDLPTNIVDFRGFDSSTILNSRGGIPRFIGDFPESLSQAMLVGTMLVGRLGVFRTKHVISLPKFKAMHGSHFTEQGLRVAEFKDSPIHVA